MKLRRLPGNSHVALQVSRESGDLVLIRGYRIWTIQNRKGHIRNALWNPEHDIQREKLHPAVVRCCDFPAPFFIGVAFKSWLEAGLFHNRRYAPLQNFSDLSK